MESKKLSSTESKRISLEVIRLGEAGLNKHIIFHGEPSHCYFDEELIELLKSGKLRLVVHSHPDYNNIEVSQDDRDFLNYIK